MQKDTWPYGEGNGNPLQDSCRGNTLDRGAWRTTVHAVGRAGHDLATEPPQPPCFLELGKGSGDSAGRESVVSAGDTGSVPGLERAPGEGMAVRSSIFARKIPWTEEPGGYSPQTRRVGHGWATERARTRRLRLGLPWGLSGEEPACQRRRRRLHTRVGKAPGRRAWQPAPVFSPGESHGQRSLAAAVHGVTRLGHDRARREAPVSAQLNASLP